MQGVLNVDTQTLRSTASAFESTGSQIQNLTNQMTQTVMGLTGNVWSGEAASAYVNKFKGLNDDITRMCKMVTEHVSDLQEMASTYESTEQQTMAEANALRDDVII